MIDIKVFGQNPQNIDPLRIIFNTDIYNPDRNDFRAGLEDPKGLMTVTAIANDGNNISGWTYDPLGKGDFTKGFSARSVVTGPGRMLSTNATTVNGVNPLELGVASLFNVVLTLIEQRPVGALVPFENNARTHTASQVNQIAASIEEFGWTNPILIDSGQKRPTTASARSIQKIQSFSLRTRLAGINSPVCLDRLLDYYGSMALP